MYLQALTQSKIYGTDLLEKVPTKLVLGTLQIPTNVLCILYPL